MQMLIHIGLGKCGSTYIQKALAASRDALRQNGVYFPLEAGRPDAYGLAQFYGFMPVSAGVEARDVGWVVADAERQDCTKIIISSEFLGHYRPTNIATFVSELNAADVEAQFLMFSRDIIPWVRSLFNQYVKNRDTKTYCASINDFIDHALKNHAIDIAKIYRGWAKHVTAEQIAHHFISADQPLENVLAPFSQFAGLALEPAVPDKANRSLSPGALYLTSLVRQAPPSPGRNRVLGRIAASDCSWVPVPPEYLEIDAERSAKIDEFIAAPFAALPFTELPVRRAA